MLYFLAAVGRSQPAPPEIVDYQTLFPPEFLQAYKLGKLLHCDLNGFPKVPIDKVLYNMVTNLKFGTLILNYSTYVSKPRL